MATSNEDIRDALIRRQTEILRMAAGTGKAMRRLLTQTDRDLQFLIERRVGQMASELPRFGKGRTERLRRLQAAIRELQGPTWKEIRAQMRQTMAEAGSLEVGFAATQIEAALPVAVSLSLPASNVLRKIAVSQPFEGKVLSRWMTELEVADRTRMMDQIRIGLMQGEGSAQIGRRVFGTTAQRFRDGSRIQTQRALQAITNTSINFITNEARQELYLANKALIPFEVYVATLDSKTTPICRSLDGKKFEVGKGPTPPVHINCRSLRVPAINGRIIGNRPATGVSKSLVEGLKGEERRKVVSQLVGQVPATESYQVFLKKQSVAFQNDVMGKTKATLFRKGGLDLDRFVTQAGKELTIKDLRTRFPDAFKRAGLD